jgi:hypothetical protein
MGARTTRSFPAAKHNVSALRFFYLEETVPLTSFSFRGAVMV